MSERLLHLFCDERTRDISSVVLPNGAILAAVNLAGMDRALSIGASVFTILYAAWRWRRDYKSRKP